MLRLECGSGFDSRCLSDFTRIAIVPEWYQQLKTLHKYFDNGKYGLKVLISNYIINVQYNGRPARISTTLWARVSYWNGSASMARWVPSVTYRASPRVVATSCEPRAAM